MAELQRRHSNKNNSTIEKNIDAINHLLSISWDGVDNRNPLSQITGTTFWALISAQYFPDAHLPPHRQQEYRKKMIA